VISCHFRWVTFFFLIVSVRIRYRSHGHPTGYWAVPFFSGTRNRSDVNGSDTGRKLLPTSVYISGRFRCNPVWKRWEVTGIDLVSSRFRQDPDDGTIDLDNERR
jgi:hypothetical protein